ncbi:Protein LTV1 [Golovinomyces cichoracearum]|uniref:Protein LTV1 n=1 Tax=Golovinomyces cichoracearum TaxID=62708 RepID=A0A420HBK2_9PEZI|nr:Protein LTV1 [Golovinomyces cichoracearum]
MARKKWIDKKTASHFTLVHRPQNDPLIHDPSASSTVLNPTINLNTNKSKKLDDLILELGPEVEKIRANEGEAATHGIYYDDTEYDYMQHMRDLGTGSGESYFVDAHLTKTRNKGKEKQPLEEALKDAVSKDRFEMLLDEDILPSKNLRHVTYQAQQNIPDALAGFQPDMDPRLREVLIALEDDAYVDDQDDIINNLAKDGEEIDQDEFSQSQWDYEEAGWDSDATAKPTKEYQRNSNSPSSTHNLNDEFEDCEDHGDGAWMENFSKFKRDQKPRSMHLASSTVSSAMTTTTNGGRRRRRKGALTNPSSYSMTSSSLFRTEGMTALDARFQKIEEQYNEDLNDMASVSQSSRSSTISFTDGRVREDFDDIMDEFLGGYSMSGKKHVRKGKYQSGIEQLDEIRRGLGPAIVRS